jgi:hypothetical protein
MFLCRVCPPRPPYFLRFADSPAAPSQPFQARQHAQTPPSPHSSSTSARFHAPRLPSWPAASPCLAQSALQLRSPARLPQSARRPTPPCLSTRLALPHRARHASARSLAQPRPAWPPSPRLAGLAPTALAQARPPAPPRSVRSPAPPRLSIRLAPLRRTPPASARSPAPPRPAPPRPGPLSPSLAQPAPLRSARSPARPCLAIRLAPPRRARPARARSPAPPVPPGHPPARARSGSPALPCLAGAPCNNIMMMLFEARGSV